MDADPDEARRCRREFYIMCTTFSVNHATVTTPILYASSVLTNSAGQGGNAVLYGATLVSSLFLANLLFAVLGAKKGLSISMLLYTIYVFLFALSASMCAKRNSEGACLEGDSLQLPIVVIGSIVGGLGAGLLWTCQGAFFSLVCERVASAEGKEAQAVTAELAGTFGFVFLGLECTVRATATLLHSYANLSFAGTFYIFAALAFAANVTFQLCSTNLQREGGPKVGNVCQKVLAAVSLWKDPKIWVLQATNITFGFAAAWNGGYVGRNIFSKALNSGFIGFAGALLSGLAAILAKVFAPLSQNYGKGPIIAVGAAAFLCLGIFSKWVGTPAEWGWGVLIFYGFMGVGRAVYESTNKAIFADFFPGDKSPGAFANVFVFGTAASTAAFVLGAEERSEAELYLLLIFAVLTIPGFLVATALKLKDARAAESDQPRV